jgi:hypothetical protein
MPQTTKDGPGQLDLGHALERNAFEREGSRRPSASPAARGAAQVRLDRGVLREQPDSIKSAARVEAEEMVREELREFLERTPVGAEFQASDFTGHLQAVGAVPDKRVFDLRSTGGWFLGLVSKGVLSRGEYRSNAGVKDRNYNGTPRLVYRLERHPAKGEL